MAALLYFVPFGKRGTFPLKVRILLAVLRFVVVTLLLFLILGPIVTRRVHEKEKPIVVIAQDNSRSVMLAPDSTFYANDYQSDLKRLEKRLAEKYEVVPYSFGEKCSSGTSAYSFDEKCTDISSVFKTVAEVYDGCNVGAVVMATDGIYNKGPNPLSTARKTSFPIYTVGLGDTTLLCDARINHVRNNAETALNHKFPVEVTIVANRLKGQRQTLTVTHEKKTLFTKQIDYTSDRFSVTESLMLPAEKPGLQTYKISIGVADGEYSAANNSYAIHVRVLDRRQKVAIVAAAPHPDVAAIRRALETNDGFEVEVFTAEDFIKQLGSHNARSGHGQFDLAVVHQLPCKGSPNVCGELAKQEIPVLYVLGANTDLNAFNTLQTGVSIRTNLQNTVEATAAPNNTFASFAVDGSVYDAVAKQAPLQSPFGNYEASPSVQTLFYSKVGNIATESPLVAVGGGAVRCAWVFGEGMWRWRLHDLADNGQSLFFDPLISQLALYVSTQTGHNRLKVTVPTIVRSDERVILNAVLYDDNLQPTNTADVKLTIQRPAVSGQQPGNQAIEYLFNRHLSAYRLDVGFLDEGRYVYKASTTLAGKNYSTEGVFVVSEADIEAANITADHVMLQTMAEQSDGRMVSPHELDSLGDWLLGRDDIKTVIHTHTVNHSLLNLWWILALIILLLGVEWAVRKYNSEL